MNAPKSGPKAWMFATAAGALVLVTLVTGAALTVTPLLANVTAAFAPAALAPPESDADPVASAQTPEPAGAASNAPTADPALATTAAVPTMLILDASGSMVRDVASGGTRMQAARAAATTMVDGVDPATELGLMVFGTGTGNSDAEQAAGCSDVRTLQPVGPIDKAAYNASIAGIVESGFTPIGPALRSAAEQLPGGEPATVVLVTDGVDTCSPPSSCDVAREVLDAHPLLTIEVIGFAVDADEQAQSQLQCIAALGSGSYVDVADAAQLAARLRAATSSGDRVSATGYGSARLGMTLEQARATLPGFEIMKGTAEVVYVDCTDAALEFRGGVLTAITPKAEVGTADGIAVGADVADAVAIYGTPSAPVQGDDAWYVDFAVAPGSANGYRITYEGAGGAVSGRIIRIVVCTCGPAASAANAVSAAVSSWQVSLDAVGPIRLGAGFDEIAAAVDLNDEYVPEYCTWYRNVDTGGDAVHIGIASNVDEPYDASWIIISASSSSAAAPRTWRDAGLGMSVGRLLQAHPDGALVRGDYRMSDYVVVSGPSGSSMIFHLDASDYVRAITLSQTPTTPYEICA
ncbi:VWA domain-containing protein [Microbacteriaceae bacterium VKM Ac-2854]|nr:VWA domain-containing protein [Microbacteriaceae bacterium VKM Ac-2854]